MRIKVLSVFGTRPEAIKMCPLVNELKKDENIESIVCVTAQHREMLDSVLNIFNVVPDYDLNIMKHGQTIIDVSNRVLEGVDKVIKECNPDLVLVHGDTTTTLNGALAAFYNKVAVGHVEAGLRSKDIYSPFPEEVNRKITGTVSKLHFCPTKNNKANLINEGINEGIYLTGNTVIDALISVIDNKYTFQDDVLNNIDYDNKKIVLLTTHRRENWGDPMKDIFLATKDILKDNKDVQVVFPMHKNPKIRELALSIFGENNEQIKLIEPLEYLDFANLINKSYLVMTDSGGIQEEAPALGKPVIVLRTETERPEAVEAGTVKLVGVERKEIFNSVNELLNDNSRYNNMAHAVNPYGDGEACKRIVDIIKKEFTNKN